MNNRTEGRTTRSQAKGRLRSPKKGVTFVIDKKDRKKVKPVVKRRRKTSDESFQDVSPIRKRSTLQTLSPTRKRKKSTEASVEIVSKEVSSSTRSRYGTKKEVDKKVEPSKRLRKFNIRNNVSRRHVTPEPQPCSSTSTVNKSPIAKVIHQKRERDQNQEKKSLESRYMKTNRPVGRPSGSYKTLHIEDKHITPSAHIKRLPLHPESTVRNQLDFYLCAVCKCSTLIRTNRADDVLEKKKTKVDPSVLTFEDDPALGCSVCLKHFHLVCVYDEAELHNLALNNPETFVCQECIRCTKCTKPIFDPGNVQCIKCGDAYHGKCRPDNRDDCDFIKKYVCLNCSSTEVEDKKKGKSNAKTGNPKKKFEKVGRSKEGKAEAKAGKLSPLKSKPSPKTKTVTDEEFEASRLKLISQISLSLKPDPYKFSCMGASDSSFSSLNNEPLDDVEKDKHADNMAYIPYASVGKNTDQTFKDRQLVFFCGNVAYRPRFYDFLKTMLPQTNRIGFCHKCLACVPSLNQLIQHIEMCDMKTPPGDLIYSEGNLNVYEIQGKTETLYCRRLSLFAKTFIGSKAVHFETDGFKFYVLTEKTDSDFTVAGYFSKEIKPVTNNNLSCLLVLPWMQRKQYGLFLIDLSYQLSIRERKVGSPEHPLSDAGLRTYRQYWFSVLMSYLREKLYDTETLNLREIKEHTGIDSRDILETMIIADMTFILNDKLQINAEIPMYSTLASLRRRYVKPQYLKVKARQNVPFSKYN
ncbi:unnamed protein product [Bursaphelenchus okinawaensis]|uniref:Histone acetyltransferase n=1 Tax=Bursaphelenchus okinawaensis TaxID=465554 RepID=A0A811K872_9BILA|nr:unnamed protein product [Bursaphelenchus okinawaensis]CAG9094084.1 unnamed protein product [Bursaphelenchus okinawaensis]